jgi:DNA-binding response OmpR family regulator
MTIFYLCTKAEKLKTRVVELNALGYNVLGFTENMTLFKRMLLEPTALLIIDLEQSTEDEASIERYLAINSELVVFILVATDFDISRSITFLNAGCNRILLNTIDVELLDANIRASLRCVEKIELPYEPNSSVNERYIWKLNPINWTITTPDGKSIELTGRENKLLHMLALKNGSTLNKHYLAEKLLGKQNQNGNSRINLLIGRLRKKILRVSKFELPIKTVHSIGYALSGNVIIESDHDKQGQLDSLS